MYISCGLNANNVGVPPGLSSSISEICFNYGNTKNTLRFLAGVSLDEQLFDP